MLPVKRRPILPSAFPLISSGVFNALAEPQIRIDQGWEIFRNTFFRGRTNLHGSIYYERGKDIGAIDWEENEEDYDDAEEKYTSPAQSSQRPPLSENFEKDRHLVYLEMMYELLLYHYQSQVINFLTLAHFIISGLHFLGARDRVLDKGVVANWVFVLPGPSRVTELHLKKVPFSNYDLSRIVSSGSMVQSSVLWWLKNHDNVFSELWDVDFVTVDFKEGLTNGATHATHFGKSPSSLRSHMVSVCSYPLKRPFHTCVGLELSLNSLVAMHSSTKIALPQFLLSCQSKETRAGGDGALETSASRKKNTHDLAYSPHDRALTPAAAPPRMELVPGLGQGGR
ncbi:hypothetical protein Bca101_080670 [Brassica carinata]